MRRRSVTLGIGTCVAVSSLLLGALASNDSSAQGASSGNTSGTRVQGGTVTWAEQPESTPDFIYPFMPARFYSVTNTGEFQSMMYRPLLWFGTAKQPTLNRDLSLARHPKYAKGDKRLTITLKRGIWSNGEQITTTDVVQWLNMAHAEKNNWAPYDAGVGIPDDITGVTVRTKSQLIIRLAYSVSTTWFNYNMLSQITPLPEAWDITHAGAEPGSGGCGTGAYGKPSTDAACAAVWRYMTAQAGYDPASPGVNTALTTYASNPLWQVVDGPWRLDAFDPDGEATFVPNERYSGQDLPAISKFVEVPFPTASAELHALDNGQLSVGYLPLSDATKQVRSPLARAQEDSGLASRYVMVPDYTWSINSIPYNFDSTGDNGAAGKIFQQLYFRQAFQMLVDQPKLIKNVDKGYGIPTYSPTPLLPTNTLKAMNPYPYNPSKAVHVLEDHGWNVVPNGIDTCSSPGTGAHDCGAGIPTGAKLDFTLMYASGSPTEGERLAKEKQAWDGAGISVDLVQASEAAVTASATACQPGPSCTWELASMDTARIFTPDHFPTGEEIFSTGAPFNYGSYSDPINDNLTEQTEYTLSPLLYYRTYLAKELPALYQDRPVAYLWEINKKLRGVDPVNIYDNYNPERFSFAK